ncbi:MAG: glycosyltransferase family 2 protein [Promethearchaeota archaeon]
MKKLSIIIPCYNEEETIHKLLDYLELQEFPVEHEVIIVDDGSERELKPHIEKYLKRNHNYSHYRLPTNQGKGVAVRLGFSKAKGDYVIIQDADLEYLPRDIPKLLEPVIKHGARVVFGSRLLGKPKGMSIAHNIGNRLLTFLTNLLFQSKLTDMETGYKLVERKVVQALNLEAREFELEPELTGKILGRGHEIIEVPISYKYRLKGQAKINVADGLEAILVLLMVRYFPNSKFWARVHKVLKFHLKGIVSKVLGMVIPSDFH